MIPIRKGRTYGAIIGEMRDKTYEKRIAELEEQNKELTRERDEAINMKNLSLAELAHIKTSEPPIKKDFKAMG